MRRLVVAFGFVVAALLAPSPASADPAGPTDFETSIVSIEVADGAAPDDLVDLFSVQILGGDSFVELSVEAGAEIRVPGYRNEPYLWFQTDGTVLQNDRSPSRWLNEDRYSEIDLPEIVDEQADPLWVEVATGGTYAWHDHRAHWMNGDKPLGSVPGDQVANDVVLLLVADEQPEEQGDGWSEVRVGVVSVLLEPPSRIPAFVGLAAGLVLSAIGLRWWLSRRSNEEANSATDALMVPAFVVVLWSVVAAVAGLGTTLGLPGEASPGITVWALPAVGALVVVVSVIVRRRSFLAEAVSGLALGAALVLAGAELLLWLSMRRSAITSALIPTELPMWLDRAIVAGAAPAGLLAIVVGLVALLVPQRRSPNPAPAGT